MLQNRSSRRVLITSATMMFLGAAFAVYFAIRWVHMGHADTAAKNVYPFIVSVIVMLDGLMRFLYRNKRNYYSELMKQRRSSETDAEKTPPIIKGWD